MRNLASCGIAHSIRIGKVCGKKSLKITEDNYEKK